MIRAVLKLHTYSLSVRRRPMWVWQRAHCFQIVPLLPWSRNWFQRGPQLQAKRRKKGIKREEKDHEGRYYVEKIFHLTNNNYTKDTCTHSFIHFDLKDSKWRFWVSYLCYIVLCCHLLQSSDYVQYANTFNHNSRAYILWYVLNWRIHQAIDFHNSPFYLLPWRWMSIMYSV